MKKLFTLLVVFFAAISYANAQNWTKTWNFSTWEDQTIKATTTIDGLTVAATEDASVAVDANSKTVDGVEYTKRLKLGGTGKAESRHLKFDVAGPATIKVIRISSSSSGGARTLNVAAGTFDNVIGTIEAPDGGNPAYDSFEYTGEATTLYLYSASSGINIYAIYVEEIDGPIPAQPEVYTAITMDEAKTMTYAPEFAAVTDMTTWNATNAVDGKSIVKFGTANMDCEAVGGTTPKDVPTTETGEFAGWTEGWNDVKWKNGNNGDLMYPWLEGSGNPAIEIKALKKYSESESQYKFSPDYEYYKSDGSNGLPVMGLYYKFTPKVDGHLTIKIWANKGSRRTFIVDESTMKALPYEAEGYINGKKDAEGKMQFFTNAELQAQHAEKEWTEPDDAYVIALGNQAFFGNLNIDVVAGKTYWLFQHSSQIGFNGYEFTPASVDPALEPNPEDNLLDEDSYNFNKGIGAWYGWGTGSFKQATPGYEGSAGCLHLVNPTAGNAWDSQLAYDITLEQGQDYTMAFYAKALNEGGKVQFAYQNSETYSGGGYQDINLTTDWQQYMFHWAAVSQTDVMNRITINYGAVANEFFFDRVYLIKGQGTGIEDINVVDVKKSVDNRIFNLQGVQVDKNYKGIVIMNGKRYLNK